MTAAKTLLSIEQLRYRWPSGQRDLLDIASLQIKAGERVFIKGSSGTGKTTLLSLIGGINTPNSGNIRFLDQAFSTLKQRQRDQVRADHIGFIFQLFNLIPYLSVIENIMLSCQFSGVRKQRALERSPTLEQEAMRMLEHLQMASPDIIGKPVSELSVGQQQRVATARALIGAPEMIIADEPTSALDAGTREQFLQLLFTESNASGSAVLFVSHDSALEKGFDRTLDLVELNQAAQGSFQT